MSAVNRLLEVNQAFYNFLKQGMPEEEREGFIQKINDFIKDRQQLIEGIQENCWENEKNQIKEIIRLNSEIDSMLEHYFTTIKMDIKSIKNKKKTTKKYSNPYESVNFDGTFLDKRR